MTAPSHAYTATGAWTHAGACCCAPSSQASAESNACLSGGTQHIPLAPTNDMSIARWQSSTHLPVSVVCDSVIRTNMALAVSPHDARANAISLEAVESVVHSLSELHARF